MEPELLGKMNAYWRAANHLSVGQIYLYDNPLLKRPLALSDVKPLVWPRMCCARCTTRSSQASVQAGADAALTCLRRAVPAVPVTCFRRLGRPRGRKAAGPTGIAGPGGHQSGRSPRLPVGGDRSTR